MIVWVVNLFGGSGSFIAARCTSRAGADQLLRTYAVPGYVTKHREGLVDHVQPELRVILGGKSNEHRRRTEDCGPGGSEPDSAA